MDARGTVRRLAAPVGAGAIGWTFGRLLADVVAISPSMCLLAGVGLAAIWDALLARGRRSNPLALPWAAGLLSVGLPWVVAVARPHLAGRTFERVGLVWWGGAWSQADVATYAGLLALGALAGGISLSMIWCARRDRGLMWIAGLTTLGLAALWRTVVFPPSGDEPTLLFAAWHWLATGSLDLSHAMGEPGELWSRAVDFRADFAFHTVGPVGGAAYIFHGVWLPCVYGAGLWLGGRFGLALLLVGVAAVTVWLTDRVATAVLGRAPSPVWLAALLVGGPLAAYTVFMSADLFGAVLFAVGAWGLVRRKPAAVAAAAILLPWINHKLFFTAAGLLLAQLLVAPGPGLWVAAAFAAGFIPEVLVIAHALELPLWPVSEFLGHRAAFGASGVKEFMPGVVIQSVPGLLADRYAGLIQFPAWVLALAGCWWWVRHGKPRTARAVQLAALPYLVILLFYNSWPGGTGTPGRMLVMVMPALALGLAAVDRTLGKGSSKSWWTAALWMGIIHAHVVLFIPPLAFASAKEKIEAWCVARTGIDPLACLPAVSQQSAGVFPGWLALGWLAVVVTACAYLARRLASSSRRSR
jgi:hypothetical protein